MDSGYSTFQGFKLCTNSRHNRFLQSSNQKPCQQYPLGSRLSLPQNFQTVQYRVGVCVPLSSGTSGWQNYGAFVWKQEVICLIFANRPCVDSFIILLTSECYLYCFYVILSSQNMSVFPYILPPGSSHIVKVQYPIRSYSKDLIHTATLYKYHTHTHISDQRTTGMIVICMECMVIVAMTSVALSSVLKTQFKTFQKLSYPFDEPPFLQTNY